VRGCFIQRSVNAIRYAGDEIALPPRPRRRSRCSCLKNRRDLVGPDPGADGRDLPATTIRRDEDKRDRPSEPRYKEIFLCYSFAGMGEAV
jgi:hypothetical protein